MSFSYWISSHKVLGQTTHIQCGRGLAPDSGGSVTGFVADSPLSGASPLPHFSISVGKWTRCVVRVSGRRGERLFPSAFLGHTPSCTTRAFATPAPPSR